MTTYYGNSTPNDMITIQNAVSRFIDNGNSRDLQLAANKTKRIVLWEIVQGIRWEYGEDMIDSDAFRYGLEIAENYDAWKIREILEIICE